MNKAFVREAAEEEDFDIPMPEMPEGARNYITPAGYQHLVDELAQLLDVDRPELTRILQDEAGLAAEDIAGHPRMREIDRRIRYLRRRVDLAEVVDPSVHYGGEQVFFGATVRYLDDDGGTHEVHIGGIDEVDPAHGRISWLSPVARALSNASEGDTVTLVTPAGTEQLDILEVSYPAPAQSR